MNWNAYRTGVRRGLPVGVGYFSVSFGFGAMAAANGVKALDAALISATNLTSAGQFAGLTLILASAGLWELILTMLVINSRYALMSLSLSQKMGARIGVLPRFAIAFFNTDEIFALAMAESQPLTVPFLLGLGLTPFIGWTGGTLLGALAGSVLPLAVRTALGVMLYGMFIAIVVPPRPAGEARSGRCPAGAGTQLPVYLGAGIEPGVCGHFHCDLHGSGCGGLRLAVPDS